MPGYEAPVYRSWGRRNRSSLVRVPMYRVGKENATRVELRSPDPACNPYLAFAVMLASGLDGIDRKLKCPAPVEDNIFRMEKEERKRRKIGMLPNSLENAILEFENSDLMRKTLGDHVFENLIRNKWLEWDKYRVHVSAFELDEYLPNL